MQAVIDQHITTALREYAGKLEEHFKCDVIAYVGGIYPMVIDKYRETIESLRESVAVAEKRARIADYQEKKLVILLTTGGGVVETVEKMVDLTRHHYSEVEFIVPDMAMSAGTVWCMSGDKIWMDYGSSLGPIDPQVQTVNGTFVPALGYLDKVKEFIDKSAANTLTSAEAIMLQRLDLAELRRYEQARDLSTSLLKQWLVLYKFKNWTQHRTNNPGQSVTAAEKTARAEQIALDLADNKRWHSHSRMISMSRLQVELRLEVDDFGGIPELSKNVKIYNSLLLEHLERLGAHMFVHSARG